jgi:hypothetical protein
MRRTLLLAAALVLGAAAPAPAQPDPLDRVRAEYYAAVEEEAAIARGMQTIEAIRARGRHPPGSDGAALLEAYRGALITLRAKHGSWPPFRLRDLREGLAVLDAVVSRHPDHPEVRYLRLMSCYYLPGVLGRSGSVRDDFRALARLLPGARGRYPPALYESVVRFVLENGRPAAAERARLEAALAGHGG